MDAEREERNRERRLRRKASAQGFIIRKSREHHPEAPSWGGYMICDGRTGNCEAGSQFELSLDDVEAYLKESD